MQLNIEERSHSIWVDCGDPSVKHAVWKYLRKITSIKWENERGNKRQVYDQTYAVRSPCGRYVGLLKPSFDKFIEDLRFSIGENGFTINKKDSRPKEVPNVDFKLKEGVTFRDKPQEQAFEHLTKPMFMHVLECATGFGKTFLGLYYAVYKNKRTAYLMNAKHIKTWIKDIKSFVDVDRDDVMVIQGKPGMQAAVKMMKEGKLKSNKIFISAETFREYTKAYEDKKDYCGVSPMEFFEFFEIGTVIRDEAHEALFNLVRQTIYLNVENLVCLSATIVSEDKFIERMYEHIFPKIIRWKSENNKHIIAHSVKYTHEYGLKIGYSTGYGYNHNRYEKNLMKKPHLRNQFVEMITDLTKRFDNDYKPGMKMIIFFGMVETCEYFTEVFAKLYPHLRVNYLVGKVKKKEKDEILDKTDVIITTIGSCGTGTDIKNLAHAYNTVAIGSKKQAWQLMGRLRPVSKYPDFDPKYFYLTNMSIPSHRKFESIRRIDLIDKTKEIRTINLGTTIKKWRG